MEEEDEFIVKKPSFVPICKCYLEPAVPTADVKISHRKQQILTTVTRTENYLRERRIPELIRFFLTKLLSHAPLKPAPFLEKLIDDCMLFRAGHGAAPVLYENRHLEAVIKSFDPCNRRWLSAGQVRRLYTTLGLTPEDFLEDKVPCDVVFKCVKKSQERELLCLLSAGIKPDSTSDFLKSEDSSINNKIIIDN